jgi:hypothetical protein
MSENEDRVKSFALDKAEDIALQIRAVYVNGRVSHRAFMVCVLGSFRNCPEVIVVTTQVVAFDDLVLIVLAIGPKV